MNTTNKIRLLVVTAVITALGVMESKAQDWPQWRGANRDGVSKETGLNLDWSAKKPPLTWTFRQAGLGYSSPTVVGTTLYCQGAIDEKGFAFAIDTQTGSLKWKRDLGKESVPDRENCPRGSVTVDGDRLYLIRGIGQVHCLSAADGKVIWQQDFVKDFNGKYMSRWGYSESPLVDGDLVICTPGGPDGTMVALDKNTGALVWRIKGWTDEAGYSSPIVAEVGGVRQYIQQTAKGVIGVSKDGKQLWRVEVPGYRTAVIPTPIFHDGLVYVTSGYSAGCTCIRLVKDGSGIKAETVYANKNLTNQHGGVVLIDGYLYGHSDGNGRSWVCQNLATGEQAWTQRNKEGAMRGSVLGVGNRLLLLDERTGTLAVAAASPEGWKEFGRMEFPERTKMQTTDNLIWAHPVVAGGKLYLRDHDLLFCFDLKK